MNNNEIKTFETIYGEGISGRRVNLNMAQIDFLCQTVHSNLNYINSLKEKMLPSKLNNSEKEILINRLEDMNNIMMNMIGYSEHMKFIKTVNVLIEKHISE